MSADISAIELCQQGALNFTTTLGGHVKPVKSQHQKSNRHSFPQTLGFKKLSCCPQRRELVHPCYFCLTCTTTHHKEV